MLLSGNSLAGARLYAMITLYYIWNMKNIENLKYKAQHLVSLILILGVYMVVAASCSDFLQQTSDSEADNDFVFSDPTTARAALMNGYEKWRECGVAFGGGSFYHYVVSSSDIETQGETYSAQPWRWVPSYFYGYTNGNLSQRGPGNYGLYENGMMIETWSGLYSVIGIANSLINKFETSAKYKEMVGIGEPSTLSEIYGEAVTLRASCYYELMRQYGDVPLQTVAGVEAEKLDSRDEIADFILKDLKRVIPLMFRSGESADIDKTYMTRTYAEGLLARICLWEGGYQTRRTDLGADFYRNADGMPISFEKVSEVGDVGNGQVSNCFYGRRSDWRYYYILAEQYLAEAIANHGDITLQTSDPRDFSMSRMKRDETKSFASSRYDNPYQYVFQQMNDLQISNESVYEIPETQGQEGPRTYSFGRPSNGGASDFYPCKSYGQARLHPLYYYNDFDPNDKRRDVTCTVTGSDGHGAEAILSFFKGSQLNGGIALNKFDENRMMKPYTKKQRMSGINGAYMRYSDILLMQAEVKATLGKDGEARPLLDMVRNRAFGSDVLARTDEQIAKCGSLLNAIIEERKFEFGGEGSRKWDLIRTNRLATDISAFHEECSKMISDLRSNGYHRFDNGNEISNFIWVKLVDAKDEYGYRLTTQCPDGMEDDPVLYPGWRGQNDNWVEVAEENGDRAKSALTAGNKTNLAIKGLFNYIDPDGAEAKALEADGYTRVDWGCIISGDERVDIKYKDMNLQYNDLIYNGYDPKVPPVYMLMMHGITLKNTSGKFTNGYGFSNKY